MTTTLSGCTGSGVTFGADSGGATTLATVCGEALALAVGVADADGAAATATEADAEGVDAAEDGAGCFCVSSHALQRSVIVGKMRGMTMVRKERAQWRAGYIGRS